MDPSPEELRRVVVFQNATDDDLRLILENSVPRSIEDGEYFFLQGDPADHLYVLKEGQVKLLQSNPAGQQISLRIIYPWQMFGALGAVRDQASYPASAQALEDASALAIKGVFLRAMMETRPYLSFDLMKLMTSYIQEMQSRYRELATERVAQRIARALLRLTAQSGQRAEDGIELEFSRQDLAEMSGSTLYTVSRVLSDWDRQGLLDTGRERIRILQPHDLVRLAEGLDK
jgi:CRP/FNR family transcriptional regulator, nitrogen oxide reductase regulator